VSSDRVEVPVYDGKYTWILEDGYKVSCLRYGEPWMDSFIHVPGSNAVFQLLLAHIEALAKIKELEAQRV
jgi:hypothetical protein